MRYVLTGPLRSTGPLRKLGTRPLGETGLLRDQQPVEQLLAQVDKLLIETDQLSARFAAISDVAVAVNSSLRFDDILELLVDKARHALGFDYCAVGLLQEAPGLRGQAYNLCSEGEITQLDMLNAMTDALGLPRITKRAPFGLAMRFAFLKEAFAKLLRRREPPTITRFIVYLVGRRTEYSIAKARRELGWRPQVNIQDGVQRSLAWFHAVAPEVLPRFTVPVLATK